VPHQQSRPLHRENFSPEGSPIIPTYIRSHTPGACYFFTVVLNDRSSKLLVDEIDKLRGAYAAVTRSHPFETVAICVLPDHIHAIWRMPAEDADYSKRWSLIKRRFSVGLNDSTPGTSNPRKGETGIWQQRFWEHQLRNDRDMAQHVEYIHFNPAKHGLVAQVKDWPYSSFHQWVARGDLPAGWGLARAADGRFGE
jgi:putative transposase